MRVISRVWKRGADRPLVVDLRVVFIDISGGVAAYYVRTRTRGVCVFISVYTYVGQPPWVRRGCGASGLAGAWHRGRSLRAAATCQSCRLAAPARTFFHPSFSSSLLRVSPSSTFSPFTIAATTTLLGSPRKALSRFLLAISVTISTRAGFSIDRRYCPPTLRATVHLVHLDRCPIPSKVIFGRREKSPIVQSLFQKMRNIGKKFKDFFRFFYIFQVILL